MQTQSQTLQWDLINATFLCCTAVKLSARAVDGCLQMYTRISFCMYILCCFVSILSLFDFFFLSISSISDSLWSSLLLAINPLLPWLSFPSVKQLLQTRKEKEAASPKCSANAVISSQQDTSVQQLNTNTNWHDGAASEDWSLCLTAAALLVQFLLLWVVLVGGGLGGSD